MSGGSHLWLRIKDKHKMGMLDRIFFKEEMAFQGVTFAKPATLPTATLFYFGSFKFVANSSGQIDYVSSGVIGSVQVLRFAVGAEFRFGALDFTANKAGILRPMTTHAPSLAMASPATFGPSNFATIATKVAHFNNPTNHGRISAPPPRRSGHHGRSKRRQPQLPRELESRWADSLTSLYTSPTSRRKAPKTRRHHHTLHGVSSL
uniref:Uncharacterized protein n=1 Tax=Oryza punctata TaxID=4537 RepID=A0A0E0LBL5_ORYPU